MAVQPPGPQQCPPRIKLRQDIQITGLVLGSQRRIANRQRIDSPVINRTLDSQRVHIPTLVKTNACRTRHVIARKGAVNRPQIIAQRTD